MSPIPLPLSIYVHLPWCVKKCPYCDFNSHAVRGGLPEKAYMAALIADLEEELRRVGGRRVESVFFGGGTPSLFSAESIERIIAAIRERGILAPDAEITLEANPGAVERGRFADYAAAGVNRVSVGVQSFDADMLAALGRIHSPRETETTLEELRHAGITNVNLDLMYGLPGQDIAAALADVELAIQAQPSHISHYQLMIEPNTLFHARPPVLPDEDLIADAEIACVERLAAAGFERYFQIAHCYRDEDFRANRIAEHTQLDLEMSFVDEEDVMSLIEELYTAIAREFWPGPLTLVLPMLEETPEEIAPGRGTVAVRVPGLELPRLLAARLGRPISGVSANFHDQPPCHEAAEVADLFPDELGLVLDGGTAPGNAPSSILDLTGAQAKLLREGAISADTLERFLH